MKEQLWETLEGGLYWHNVITDWSPRWAEAGDCRRQKTSSDHQTRHRGPGEESHTDMDTREVKDKNNLRVLARIIKYWDVKRQPL